MKNDLDTNFSEKQLFFYEKVAKEVLKEKAILLEEEERNTREDKHVSKETKEISYKKIYTGVTIAGAAAAVTGLVLEKTAIAYLGLAGVVIGGVLLYKESQR